jgi:hypothetical protein
MPETPTPLQEPAALPQPPADLPADAGPAAGEDLLGQGERMALIFFLLAVGLLALLMLADTVRGLLFH